MLATMKAQIGDLVTADTPEGPVTGVLVHRLRSMLTLDVTDTPHADTHGRRPAWSGPTETLPAYYARQGARGRFCEVFAHNVTATERAPMNAVVATPVVDTVTPEKLRALVEDAITAAWGEDHVAWASLDDTSGQLVQAAVDLMGIAATARVQQADAHNGGW